MEFISGIFSRASPPHRLISSSVYSPTELSSPAGLFSQSPSFSIPSGNEESNSILQQLSGIYFPQLKHYISIHHDTCIYASYHTISFILRTSLLDPYHALHMTDLYLSGKMQLSSQLCQSLLWFSQIADKSSPIRIPVKVIPRPCLV